MITLDLPHRMAPRPISSAPVAKKRSGNFLGSSQSRLTGDWIALQQSANDEIRWDLLSLRRRAREQERNNPHVARFLKLLIKNVVGALGITPDVDAQTTRGAPHLGVNKKIADAFADWGKPKTCTANGQLGWVGVLAMAIRTWARDGEAFLRLIPADNKYAFAVQFIDADQLDETYRRAPSSTQNEINMGVEIDVWGTPVAYWFWNRHPTESWVPRKRERIPADQIIALQAPRRYGALRTETVLAPVLGPLRDTIEFIKAALVNARTGASKMGFIQKTADAIEDDEDAPREMKMEAQAGVIEELDPGETFVNWSPEFPSAVFGPFNNALLQYISVGMDLPAIEVTGDLTQTSYASARIGRLDGQDTYRQLQQWLIESVCQPVYEAWLTHAMLAGALVLPGADVERWHAVKWRPRGWSGVDPLKETTADKMDVDFGFNSRQRVCAERGLDFFEILEELAAEDAAMQKLGLTDMHLSTVIIEGDNGNGNTPQAGEGGDGTSGADATLGLGSGAAASRRLPGRDRQILALQAGGRR